jgi:nucleoside-diphosphate-sugar epimerase
MSGVVSASEKSGTPLVILGNVYGYGDAAPSPLTSETQLAPTSVKGRVRKEMWEQALASTVPVLEVRASDYIGDGAASLFTLMTLPSLLRGEPAAVIGDPDAMHAWSFTKDVAKTLVAASRYGGKWGRAFLVPSHHVSVRDLASKFAEHGHVGTTVLKPLTDAELDSLARDNEIMREVVEMTYLYQRPTILDASDTERLLEVYASKLDVAVEDTLRGIDTGENA